MIAYNTTDATITDRVERFNHEHFKGSFDSATFIDKYFLRREDVLYLQEIIHPRTLILN